MQRMHCGGTQQTAKAFVYHPVNFAQQSTVVQAAEN